MPRAYLSLILFSAPPPRPTHTPLASYRPCPSSFWVASLEKLGSLPKEKQIPKANEVNHSQTSLCFFSVYEFRCNYKNIRKEVRIGHEKEHILFIKCFLSGKQLVFTKTAV
jgi:hypothetical protein